MLIKFEGKFAYEIIGFDLIFEYINNFGFYELNFVSICVWMDGLAWTHVCSSWPIGAIKWCAVIEWEFLLNISIQEDSTSI